MRLQRLATGDRSWYLFGTTFLVLSCGLVLYPLIYCVSCSFSSTQAILQGRVVLFPAEISLASYKTVLSYVLLRVSFLNSLFYVFGGTIVSVFLLVLAAYPLSRRDLPYRKFFQTFFVITMFFSGGLIPNYLLMDKLHLIGSRWSMVLGFMFSCYNMIIVKSFFQTSLPPGLLDAAQIDGCDDIRFFFTIALPLAVPVIAVMVLFNAVWIWNSYFNGMLFLNETSTYSFQMVLREILFIAQMPPEMKAQLDPERMVDMQNVLQQIRYSVLVVGALPMMVLYPFIQKYFIRGMMIGSLKE
jgi:multiple sugar transport system permease protein/putative aldouronate transport system permease protein